MYTATFCGGLIIDKPLIEMYMLVRDKKHGFTKAELVFISNFLYIPRGCCLCESKKGGLAIDVISKDPMDVLRYGVWLEKAVEGNNIDNSFEELKDVCTGNYLKIE